MKGRVGRVLKRIAIGAGVLFLLLAALVVFSTCENGKRLAEQHEYYLEHKDEIEAQKEADFMDLGFVVEDSADDLVIDSYRESNGGSLYVYDSKYLDIYFDYPSPSLEEVKRTLGTNPNISDEYKEIIAYYIERVNECYPNADLRPFEFNLRTLEVVEVDEWGMGWATLSEGAYACYIRTENRIYLPQGKTFEPGSWDWQVIVHELSHALRTVDYDDDRSDWGNQFHYQLSSPANANTIAEEALNSLFAVSLLEYEERDIAYQLQSNMVGVMLDCMDNCSLADYPNHSYTYFLSKLDEANGNHNYASAIMKLMEAQREDWEEERWDRPQSVYYPLYDYLCKMWLDERFQPEMGLPEVDALIDDLLERVMYDVPETYQIDVAEFYRFGEAYCAEHA